MVLRNLTVRSTILQQIRCNRSRKAKDSSKSRSSTHLLLGSEPPYALDQSTIGRHLEQSHLNGRNSTPQIRLYTSQLDESDKREETNQYWSLIGAVLVRNIYQYWSELRPVLVSSVTSTGWKPTLYKRIPASFPTRFSFTRRHVVYIGKEGSEKKYQIGDTPYEKFATFAVLQIAVHHI